MYKTLNVNVDGHIGKLTLNRPNQLNALSMEMLRELTEAAHWFNDHTDLRVVVIEGQGRAFCAGADLNGFPGPDNPEFRTLADSGLRMANAIEAMNALTIVRIHGWCIGGGVVLASACDLRVASLDVRFSIPEIDLGITLGWGGVERLVRDIGPVLAKELIVTCRAFSSEEAQRMGFINRCVAEESLDQVVTELASSIADKPRLPVSATKKDANVISAQMVRLGRITTDADSLYAALLDPECQSAREAYLKALRR
ncbi:MAG: enoyl-CoA hydratase/isomerase family protein [Pseudomonadota bacterium]